MQYSIKKKNIISIICAIFIAFAVIFTFSACATSNYSPKLKQATLTKPTILEEGKLKVGVDFGNPPFAGETSKSAGIDIDIAAALADELGLEVDFVDTGTSPELAVENNKVDIVMGISKSSKVTEIWKSNPYISSAPALFAKSSVTAIPTRDGADKFATQMASQSALTAQAQFNVANIKLENSLSTAFESLAKDEVKYVAADTITGSYYAKNAELDVNIVALLAKPGGYCVGVKSSNAELINAITAAIDTLNAQGMLSVVEKKWLGKAIDLAAIQMTPEASNQADASELESGVYGEIEGTAKQDQ